MFESHTGNWVRDTPAAIGTHRAQGALGRTDELNEDGMTSGECALFSFCSFSVGAEPPRSEAHYCTTVWPSRAVSDGGTQGKVSGGRVVCVLAFQHAFLPSTSCYYVASLAAPHVPRHGRLGMPRPMHRAPLVRSPHVTDPGNYPETERWNAGTLERCAWATVATRSCTTAHLTTGCVVEKCSETHSVLYSTHVTVAGQSGSGDQRNEAVHASNLGSPNPIPKQTRAWRL